MAQNLPPALRDEVMERVYALSLQGLFAPAISKEISRQFGRDISEKCCDRYLARKRLQMRDIREAQGTHDLETYLGECDLQLSKGWELLDDPDVSATAKAHILQAVNAISTNKAKALGLFTDRVLHSGDESRPVLITLSPAGGNAPSLSAVRSDNVVPFREEAF